MVDSRGLKLNLKDAATDPATREDLKELDWHAFLDYEVLGPSGIIDIYQTLGFKQTKLSEIERQIQDYNGIYPIEDLLTNEVYKPDMHLYVAYTDIEQTYEIEMEIKPNGDIIPYSPMLWVQGGYKEAFAKLLDILNGKE
jgi:hypothetical protein